MAKKLHDFTILSKFTKNACILFGYYLFRMSVPLFNNSYKERVQKKQFQSN